MDVGEQRRDRVRVRSDREVKDDGSKACRWVPLQEPNGHRGSHDHSMAGLPISWHINTTL